MGHKETIENIEAWPNSPGTGRNTLDALVAIYRLLDERLPEKPMQVIPTPDVPQDTPKEEFEQATFQCTQDLRGKDRMRVKKDSDGEFLFESHERDTRTQIFLSEENAESLAKAILASI